MDNNLRIYYNSAKALGLSVIYLDHIKSLKIYLGGKNYYFTRTITPFNGASSSYLAKNKFRLNKLLEEAGFPVPKAIGLKKEFFIKYPLRYLVRKIKFPVVAKPNSDTGRGKDVLCNIKNVTELSAHLTECFKQYPAMQIEEFHQGLKEYRILICRNRVIGVVERYGAQIVGDGKHSVEQLIDLGNPERVNLSGNLTISPLTIDQEYKNCLLEQGLSFQSVPAAGVIVKLCHTVNTGRGGNIYSHGKKINAYNAQYLCLAAKAIGLNLVGFDILCEDINQSFKDTKLIIIEANFNPDTTIHEIPNKGIKVNVTKKILRQLIFRHPISYFHELMKNSHYAIYIKSTLIVSGLLLLKYQIVLGMAQQIR